MIDKLAPTFQELVHLVGDNEELALFVVRWLEYNRNGTKAYKSLHPSVTEKSASILGARLLAKVSTTDILSAYELGPEAYFEQLKGGMKAEKWNEFTGEREPDHKTRRTYHEALGKIHKIEQESKVATATQVNVAVGMFNHPDIVKDYSVDGRK